MQPDQNNPSPTQTTAEVSNQQSSSTQEVQPQTSQLTQAPLPENPPLRPAGSKKNIVLIIVALVLLLALGVTGYFVYQKYFIKNEAVEPSPTPTPEASTDPTANWKTFANDLYTFKYPPQDSKGNPLEIYTTELNPNTVALLRPKTSDLYSELYFDLTLLLDTQLEDWYSKSYQDVQQAQEIPPELQNGPVVDGFQSKQSVFNNMNAESVQHIFIQNGEDLYQIAIPSANNNTQLQIISTFKFVDDSTASTLNWETYTSTSYNFTFKYPEGVILEDKSVEQIGQVVLAAQGFRETNVSARMDNQNNLYLDTASVGEVTFGDTVWKKYILPDGYCDGPTCSSPILALTTVKDGTKYVFSVFVEKGSTDFTDLETEILSTFIFTN